MPHSHLEQRIEILESKLSFQELTINELNHTVVQHELEITKIREHLCLLVEKLKAASPSFVASLSEEALPPHY
ncbi:MAG: SlyX family protein [Candidatus Malihini olakiniferum]